MLRIVTYHEVTVAGPHLLPAAWTVRNGHGLRVEGDDPGRRFAHNATEEQDMSIV